jgi:hypothetical protein
MIRRLTENKDLIGALVLVLSLFGIGFVFGNNISARNEWRIMEYTSDIEQQDTHECIQQWNALNMIEMQD